MVHMTKVRTTVRQQGADLWLPLPHAVTAAAGFAAGTPVVVQALPGEVIISRAEPRELTLEDRLAAFDPARHGGEMAPGEAVGREFPHQPASAHVAQATPPGRRGRRHR